MTAAVIPFVWLRSTGFPFGWLDRLALPGLLDPAAPEHGDEGAFRSHVERSRRVAVELLSGPMATEALFLSNPESVDRVAGLAAGDLTRPTSRTRQRLRLAWRYLQRFCAKNETSSFFGPLAWGRIDSAMEPSLALRTEEPAAGWLRSRRVSMEHWVIDRLCAQLSVEHATDLPLRLHAGCDLDGNSLRVPVGCRVALAPDMVRELGRIVAGVAPGSAGEPWLGRLVDAGALSRTVSVAPETAQPLRAARAAVVAAVGPDARGAVLDVLPRLDELRDRFERGDLDERRAALSQMLDVLRDTGIETDRPEGTHYAGRSPVYEDCERNLAFTIGDALARDLRTHLTPLMELYRLTAECVASRLHEHHLRVLAATDPRVVDDAVHFLHRARAEEGRAVGRAAEDEVRDVLRRAWAVLPARGADDLELDAGGIELIAGALRSRFPEHGRFAGVLGVGVVSPDVMVAAPDLDSITRGECRIVLGEVHPGVAAVLQPVALPFLKARADAVSCAEGLLAPGRIVLAATSTRYQRSQFAWPVAPSLYELVLPGATSRCPPANRIPAGRGRIEVRDGLIHVVDRETGRSDDVVSVLSSDLHRLLFAVAGDVLGASRPERTTYRGIQVTRRSWRIDPAEIPAVTRPAEEFADYTALRDWARGSGLPRRGFLSADTEAKPVYVDWASPLAVDTFAKIARGAGRIRITEMSPDADELWFVDHTGTHTAEFRMTFVV